MRSFIADEPFEPVEKLLPAPPPGTVELTVRQQKVGLLLIAVIFVAIGCWVAFFIDDPSALSHGLAFCAVGALALFVSRIPWSKAGRPKMSDTQSRVILGGASVVLLFMALQSFQANGALGAFWIELAAVACTALFVYKEASAYQDRKIAKLMRESASATPTHVAPTTLTSARTLAPPATPAPPELAALARTLAPPATSAPPELTASARTLAPPATPAHPELAAPAPSLVLPATPALPGLAVPTLAPLATPAPALGLTTPPAPGAPGALASAAPVPAANDPLYTTHQTPPTTGIAPPLPTLRLDIYQQDELPALPARYQTPIAPDANIIGQPPHRILYLYNFFSLESLVHKVKGNWRRFGPVYFLGSPGDFSFGHTFDSHVGTSVLTAILPTPESFDARLKSATDTVLPPGGEDLKGISHFSGGYPHHLFLCNDGSWRHAVDRLIDHVDLVMLDACGYDAQRAGLNWEIGQLVDRIASSNLVVLIDVTTDQAALCAAFRTAWHAMAETSPNNTTAPAPVRWVLLDPPEARSPANVKTRAETPRELPPEADPLSLYPKCNPLTKALAVGNYRDALLDDRIFGLFAVSRSKQNPT